VFQRWLFVPLFWLVLGFALGGSFVWATTEPVNQEPNQPPTKTTSSKAESEQPWLTKDAAGFFTFLLVIVGGAQLLLFVWQLWLIRESLDDARIAADAAKESADAAKIGAQATRDHADIARVGMIASERAYVHHSGFRWISHRDPADDHVFWRIRPRWINGGNTPTRQAYVYVQYEFRDNELPPDFAFVPPPFIPIPALMGPKGIVESGHWDLNADDLKAIRDGKKHFYVWGIARYRDVFPGTPVRITRFCAFIDAVTGNPFDEWDEKTNAVEIRFATYHRHNCADEDCDE
jgi:hypothetical protein